MNVNGPLDGRISPLPREKLFEHGITILTDAELLALVIGTGSKNRSSVMVGEALLKSYSSLREMASRGVRDFLSQDGIGPTKAARLAATFELGRRLSRA